MSGADRTWNDPTLPRPASQSTTLWGGPGNPVDPGELPPRYDRATLEVLGQGGLGTVFSVHDAVTGRKVALKVLHRRPETGRASRGMERRFLREARITAQLQHPGIVPVYEIGSLGDGSQFYSMKRVRGRTMGEQLARLKTMQERLGLLPELVQVAHAVAYAHSRGVVHRDLKPANVMVGEFGETLVLDWGIARLTGDVEVPDEDDAITDAGAADRTAVGTVMGTPAYMSPEQARGDLDLLDTRSDVWSLGVMLFELVTGRRPFDGDDVLDQVRHGVAPRVRDVFAEAPPELAAIAERALSADPDDRYRTAADLASDLEAWLGGRVVSTYRYGLSERVGRAYDRVRTVVVTAAVTALVAGLAGAWGVGRERSRHDGTRDELRDSVVAAARAHATHEPHVAAGEWARALALADEPEGRAALMTAARRWHPELERAERATCEALTWAGDGSTCGDPELRQEADVAGVTVTARGGVVGVQAPTGPVWFTLGRGAGAVWPAGALAVAAFEDGGVWFVDPAGPTVVGRLPERVAGPAAVAVAPDGSALHAVSADGELGVWSLAGGGALGGGAFGPHGVPDEVVWVAGGVYGLAAAAQEVRRYEPASGASSGAWGVGAPERLVGGFPLDGGGAEVWVRTRLGYTTVAPAGSSAAFGTPSGSRGAVVVDRAQVVLAGDDGVPVLWSVAEARELVKLDLSWARALPRAVGRTVVFETPDGVVSTLDLDTQRLGALPLSTLAGAQQSPDGARVSAAVDGRIDVVDVATGATIAVPTEGLAAAHALTAESPGLLAYATGGAVTLVQVDPGAPGGAVLARDRGPRGDVRWLSFSPDGAELWFATDAGVVAWDTSLARVPAERLAAELGR
jgi:hypothetical protein